MNDTLKPAHDPQAHLRFWPEGVPHRIDAFDAALAYICRHARVWKATGSEIARHYRAQIAAA